MMTNLQNDIRTIYKGYIDEQCYNIDINLLEEIISLNHSFIFSHGLTMDDIQIYLNFQNAFNQRLLNSNNQPQKGDLLEIWSNNGYIFYKNANLETLTTYCEQGLSHYFSYNDLNTFSTSGGKFDTIKNNLEYIGEDVRTIWTWGHTGACADGGLYIKVKVNKFKMTIDRDYIPFVCFIDKQEHANDYKYYIKTFDKNNTVQAIAAFRTLTGFKNFLKNRQLKIGKKMGCYHKIIGDYNDKMLMSKKEYDKIKGDLKEFPILNNGEYTTAFFKLHTVYYCNPNVKERTKLPYIYE